MPELRRFYSIIIKMIYSDNSQHHKPHFHVFYAEHEHQLELTANCLPEACQ